MKRIKTWEELTIQDNYLFRKALMKEPKLLRRLLEGLLEFSILKIDFPQSEKVIDTDFKTKKVHLDVYVEDQNKQVYDIKMEITDLTGEDLFLRTRYYTSP